MSLFADVHNPVLSTLASNEARMVEVFAKALEALHPAEDTDTTECGQVIPDHAFTTWEDEAVADLY